MSSKRLGRFIVLLVLLSILVGIWLLAGKVVDLSDSFSWNKPDTLENNISGMKEYDDETVDGNYAKVDKLFSSNNLLERQKKFLGEDYTLYEEALLDIEENYEKEFSKIPSVDGVDSVGDYQVLERSALNPFSKEDLAKGECMYSESMMTIVGLYGTHCVVYKYGYGYDDSSNLIAVDYSDALFDKEYYGLFGFGQTKTLFIEPKYSRLVERDGYSILYVKEF